MTKKVDAVAEDEEAPTVVLVEALMPMWAAESVVPPGTRYHLPVETAEYLAGLGFVAIVEEAG